jgi:uncharacterized membrane protein
MFVAQRMGGRSDHPAGQLIHINQAADFLRQSCGTSPTIGRFCLHSGTLEDSMADADSNVDDAPPSTSKRSDAVDRATETMVDANGDQLIGRTVTINRPAAELYAYWRDFSNLPTFMDNVVSIDRIDDRRTHWVVKAPGGRTVEWDALITDERENDYIAWASDEGADVPNSGRIEFRDAGARGTVVTATILYDPPGGVVGKVIAKLFQREPAIQARRDLRRFKQLMETGEVATSAMNRKQHEEELA